MPLLAQLCRLAALATLLSGAPVRANDTVAHLGAGGLEFGSTDVVVMEREHLRLSPERVSVDYVFRNVTTAPVELRVAFPLPRLDMNEAHGCSDMGIPDRGQANFLDFATTVGGQPVRMEMQTKAFVKKRDVTALLQSLDIPFADTSARLPERLRRLTPTERARLREAGALGHDEGCADAPQPLWTAETIYHWQQRFEPGVETRISHRYRPALGGFFVLPHARGAGPGDENLKPFCVDEGTWRAIRATPPRPDGVLLARNLEYILQTARAWSGPIRNFTLTIDKGKPTTIVSLCMTGIRKTGSTTFEVKRQNFRSESDINLLFMSVD